MADNVTAPAAGTVLATKDIGGVQFPKNVLTDFAGADVLGLVDPSPGTTTLLGRLKAIADAVTAQAGYVDGLEALAGTLNGYVDTLETLQTSTNSSLATLAGYVDGLETLLGTTNTSLATLAGYMDGVEGLQATTNTALATLAGYLDGVETLLGAATPAGANIIGKVGVDQTTDGTTNKVNIDASLKSGTSTATTPAQTATSAAVLAANTARKGATIYNPNAAALNLNLAGGNAATAVHVQLAQFQSYEIGSGYTGAVTGALASGSGNANVVEFT